MLRANPDLEGFFVANDDMGLGVARAVANAGKTGKVKVISVDGIKDALEAVKAGDAGRAPSPSTRTRSARWASRPARPPRRARRCRPTSRPRSQLVTKDNADKALAATPKPFGSYADPFKDLIK